MGIRITGIGKRETQLAIGNWEMENRKWELVNRNWETGNGNQEMGIGKSYFENRK
ncbi:MAG: hypothetical protein JW736_03700 [Deltaproteobacteria bacterium]|nr:hypothetical protein [Deltaproteobacteria bacterium]